MFIATLAWSPPKGQMGGTNEEQKTLEAGYKS